MNPHVVDIGIFINDSIKLCITEPIFHDVIPTVTVSFYNTDMDIFLAYIDLH